MRLDILSIKPMQTVKLCSKEECYREFCRGNKIAIGYSNKDDGAFWSNEQFKHEMKDYWENDLKFKFLIAEVKKQIPHTRIKYGIYKTIE